MRIVNRLYAQTGVALASALLIKTSIAHAEATFGTEGLPIQGEGGFSPTSTGTAAFVSLANTALNIVLLIVGVLAVFYLIYSGFLYITSAGNPDKVKQARQGIINSIIGIIIVVAAFFIVRFAVGIGSTVTDSNA